MYVEFFGVPRERAGVSEMEVEARSLGQLFGTLSARIPALHQYIRADGLHPAFVANLNGDRFVADPATPLAPGDHVLILSADAGG